MIPVNEPLFSGREKELLMECIDTGWVSSDGPFVKEFEERFSEYIGVDHGVAVCNGTAAIETALYAMGVGEGDEVIMPTFTIVSCAVAALRLGAKPVLVDIEPETWCMDVRQIESKITGKTKAIMPVHIYGHPVEMAPVMELAEQYSLIVVEDAAEAHGAEYLHNGNWKKCGSMGRVSAFSFYANKIITTGEGGMVLTKDEDIAERARLYRNLCFVPGRRFYHEEIGYNFRMTNLQAALGVAQVERTDDLVAIKRRLGERYRKCLSDISGVRFQIEKPWARTVYWMYSIELDESIGIDAETMMGELKKRGIGTRPFFLGLHEQPAFQNMGLFKDEQYPVAERAFRQGLYLPSGLALKDEQLDEVCAAVRDIVLKKKG
jgi:perosamine synthetase